jgi:hypothetical protein
MRPLEKDLLILLTNIPYDSIFLTGVFIRKNLEHLENQNHTTKLIARL